MLDLAPLADRYPQLTPAQQAHVDALLRAAMVFAGVPASAIPAPPPRPAAAPKAPPTAIPPCHWRGPLLERCSCGNPLRDVWQCAHPAAAFGDAPGRVTGRLCANCKHAAPPSP